VEIHLLNQPDGDVIARGSYYGGPDYEFVVAHDGQVYFRVVGDEALVWAGADPESFRRIASAWEQYQAEVRCLPSDRTQLDLVERMRQQLANLGAFPVDLPAEPEPLWSLLLFEAKHGLG
jgi:hypothetical protein